MTTQNTVVVTGVQELAAEATGTLAAARDFKIVSNEQYTLAGERLRLIKGLLQKIEDTFGPHIKRAHDAHKALLLEKQTAAAPLIAAEGCYKSGRLKYENAVEAERRRQEAIAQEAARKEREKLEAQAAKAEEKGKAEKAEALRAAAATVPTPVVRIEIPKDGYTSRRSTWKAVMLEKWVLIEAVAGGRRRAACAHEGPERRAGLAVPIAALDENMAFLNQMARALKDQLNYPGVTAVEEQTLASRSA